MDTSIINMLLSTGKFIQQKEYWTNKLSEKLTRTNFLADFATNKLCEDEKEVLEFLLTEDEFNKIDKLSKKSDTSTYLILLAALKILVHRYTGSTNITIGSPVYKSTCTVETINDLVAIYNEIDGDMTFKECLVKVKQSALEAYDNQDYPFTEIVKEIELEVESGNESILDITCLLENIHGNLSVNNLKSDMVFYFYNTGESLKGRIIYNQGIFSQRTIQKICKHYTSILKCILDDVNIKVSDIKFMSKDEEDELLYVLNPKVIEFPFHNALIDMFEEAVDENTDNIAVVFKDTQLTYRELDRRSNQLANYLVGKGVGPNSVAAIMVDRSIEMVIGILGILKTGGAYLPIDSAYPSDRINYMIEDSGATILVTQDNLKSKTEFKGVIVDIHDSSITAEETFRPNRSTKPSDLAYIIYTSGTTGKPKGVMVEQQNILNSIQWRKMEYNLNNQDSVLQLFSYSFDGFLTSFFTPIVSGSKTVILDNDEVKDAMAIKKYIVSQKVTHFICIPVLYSAILDCLEQEEMKSLRVITLAGEKVSSGVISKSKEKNMQTELVNEYGPTENSVVSTVQRNMQFDTYKIIGKPIANVKVYILDKNFNLQPIGAIGEICLSGSSLARGYINRPELTAEKFVESPFENGDRIYRTGDLGRWTPEGNIEFMGRIDQQVKIRGYRIELGEIETLIMKNSSVKEAFVTDIDDKNGSKSLAAYLVAHDDLDIAELEKSLSCELPDYMIPQYFIKLDKLPLTPNGKIDKKALPWTESDMYTGAEYEAPRDEVEEKLKTIWQGILGIERVGINDSFFRVGGHSLNATNLMAVVHKEFDVEIPLMEIFKAPTIRELAEYIRSSCKSIYSSIEPVEKKEKYKISSAQKRLYILSRLEGAKTSYNIPGAVIVNGKLDKTLIEETFRKLINRHEAFRTSFEMLDEEPFQRIHESVDFNINYMELGVAYDGKIDEDRIGEVIQSFIRPFDLSTAPLIRVGLIRVSENIHFLVYDMHHIIADGTSLGILVKEFVQLYSGQTLQDLKIQYKDFSSWQNNFLQSEDVKKQEEYWKNEFSGEIPVLNLATDYKRPAIQSFEGDRIYFEIEEELSDKLKKIACNAEATLYMVMLAAYNILLTRYSGQEEIVVGSPIAGRPHADLENIIGMFVNTLAIKNYPKGSKMFSEFLNEVKEKCLKAYENQDFQFEELVDRLDIKRDLSRNPLFDTMFVMQNIDIGKMETDKLNFEPMEVQNSIAKFDLTFSAAENSSTISMSLEYCTKIFKRETAEKMAEHYLNILRQVTDTPDVKLSEIDIISKEEKEKILLQFNNTVAKYPQNCTLHELFSEQAKKFPESIAVVVGNEEMSYKELDEKSNMLSWVLREKGVERGSLVGIMAERSFGMIIGILGILKAGGAYLPIDPDYPEERIKYIFEDSKINILLSTEQLIQKSLFEGCVIDINDAGIYMTNSSEPIVKSSSQDLAYVIYTSGSTGKPKGIMVEHRNILNYIRWRIEAYKITQNDTAIQLISLSFDGFCSNFYSSLLTGGKLVLPAEEYYRDYTYIKDLIYRHKVTNMSVVPFMYREILQRSSKSEIESLRFVVLAAEKADEELIRLSGDMNPKTLLINEYGPTENSVTATAFIGISVDRIANIGRPIANNRVYILTGNSLAPIGVTGELCIGGESLSRGYNNRPDLTAEKFVVDPFVSNERIYRTGDLARWLSDGNLEYMGRIDHQVKIRGFRVEPGEIEAAILKSGKVKQVVVIDIEHVPDIKSLCAFVVPNNDTKINELRDYLTGELPDYMVPSYFVQADEIPKTPNGKVDRVALQKLTSNITKTADVEENLQESRPQNDLEEKLEKIWRELLGLERVGVNSNFFEIGGNSMLLIRMHSKLEVECPGKIKVTDLFANPTISKLAKFINNIDTNQKIVKEKVETEETHTKAIAVIGMSGEFAHSSSIQEFWNDLRDGVDFIEEIPEQRRKDVELYLKYINWDVKDIKFEESAYISEIDKFDHEFFRISPREASLMDPNQRLFLETAWKAVEDAGYGGEKLVGSRTGVYLGFSSALANVYQQFITAVDKAALAISRTGNIPPIIASRISYLLDLKGPSMLIDTACSSSLVAVHLACKSIINGECDQAIVGSIKINMLPIKVSSEDKIGIESSDGRTKTFDDSSDGTGGGEGVGAIILKPLDRALADGDNIYAVIKGSAINQDGSSIGITAPNVLAQEEVILRAWEDAEIDPETISYIEAHGTGTKLGDPIEIDGITRAFSRYTERKEFCAIGSVKTNIGHLDNAAGIAGLIKTIMALKNRKIPPLLHFNKPNRDINFEESPVYVAHKLTEWDTVHTPRRAGVSAFGISGTNAHIVLEEAPETKSVGHKLKNMLNILTISAKSKEALVRLVEEYKKYVQVAGSFEVTDFCYTANTGRGHYEYRLAVIAENETDLKEKLMSIDTFDFRKKEGEYYFYGETEENPGDPKALRGQNDEKIRKFISSEQNDLVIAREICRFYTCGGDVKWEHLYAGEKRQKVSLPTYQFERKRCWIEIPETKELKLSMNGIDELTGCVDAPVELSNEIATTLERWKKQLEEIRSRKVLEETDDIRLLGRASGCYSGIEKIVAKVWGEELGLKEIDVVEDFYELGGDSILALQITNDISKRLAIKIGVPELLRLPTIESFSRYISEKVEQNAGEQDSYKAIPKVEERDHYELSSAQKRLFVISQMEDIGTTFNMPTIMVVEGTFDLQRLEKTFNELVERHEALRTSFEFKESQPVQRVHKKVDFKVEHIEMQEDKIDEMIEAFIRPFDLAKAPLVRVCVAQLEAQKYLMMIDMHHIISDGTSTSILVGEFVNLYNGKKLAEPILQYKDFAAWQNSYINSKAVKKQREYWLDRFKGEIPLLDLPTDYKRTAGQDFCGDRVNMEIDRELTRKLNVLVQETGATLYTVMLSVFNILLSKYSGQEDIVIGSPISGRHHSDIENIVGVFINMLAMRNQPLGRLTFKEFLDEVKKNTIKAFENQDCQFEDIVQRLGVDRIEGRRPLFDVSLVLQNIPVDNFEIGGLKFRPYDFKTKTSQFDLLLMAVENEGGIALTIEYLKSLFDKTTVLKLGENFINILKQVIEDRAIRLEDIDISMDLLIAKADILKNDDGDFEF